MLGRFTMLEQFDELYNDKAYLNALTDWLSDTEGEDDKYTMAVRMLACGIASIVKDTRNIIDETEFDLFCPYRNIPKVHPSLYTVYPIDSDWIEAQTRIANEKIFSGDIKYVDVAKNHIGSYRYSTMSPRQCLELLANRINVIAVTTF